MYLNNLKLINHLLVGRSDLTPSEKLVAISLASHRNVTSFKCCPSEETIAEKTGLTKRTVITICKSLVNKHVFHRMKINRGKRIMHTRNFFQYDIADVYEIYNDEDSTLNKGDYKFEVVFIRYALEEIPL